MRVAWDARPRDLERDASQLHRLLRRLGEIDGRLAHWYAADAAGVGQALLSSDSPEAIVSRLEADRREWDHDSRHYTGYQATFGNNVLDGGACTIQVAFGIDVPSTTIWFPNSFSLQLWGPGRADSFHDAALVKLALVAAAETFQARWGMAGPRKFPQPEPLDDEMAGRPLVSWLLYLSAGYGTPPPLPPPSSVEPCAGGGHLIAVASEWLDPADGEQVAARDLVQATLGHAGLLRPAAVDVVE